MPIENDLTRGSLVRGMLRFSVPYLISCFLQTFYGLADLFITGRYNGADTLSAVSIGSQLMHVLTVVLVGLAMGSTVTISRSLGARDRTAISKAIGNSVTLFAGIAAGLTVILLCFASRVLSLLSTPPESFSQARAYSMICFAGIPFITAYNVLCSIFRGLGDTKRPMYFVAVAGVINIGLDILFIGPLGMGAAGAALATVISQGTSVLMALLYLKKGILGIRVSREDIRPDSRMFHSLLGIGAPIALQDGIIQISFLVITAIANGRGVNVAAAVGVVEKIISLLFLVPSAMLSTVSAAAAQNAGAGLHERSRQALRCGLILCVSFGSAVFILCQFLAPAIVSLFSKNSEEVVRLGAQYLRSYSLDCAIAGMHFCASGFFSAYRKSMYSFIHNILSVLLIRIPGTWLTSALFPATLYPMGFAAPMGSLLSSLICLYLYKKHLNEWN